MKIGNIDVTSMKIGSTNVAKAYVGSTQVYPSSQPTPTGYTYYVTITGLQNGDTTDIQWDGGSYVDYGVGNGTYTYTSANDSIGVYIEYVPDYSVDYSYFQLYDYDPSMTVTFTYQGGGGGDLQYIPQGTDMTQYYYRTITRFKIGDSALPYGYQVLNINFGGQHGQVSQWVTNFTFSGNQVTSLPCDVSGSDVLNLWDCSDQNWSTTHNNPFTDLWIEFA